MGVLDGIQAVADPLNGVRGGHSLCRARGGGSSVACDEAADKGPDGRIQPPLRHKMEKKFQISRAETSF